MGCCRLSVNGCFYQRVTGKAIPSMQSCARTFAHSIKSMDGTLPIQIYLYTTTHIMGTGADWYIVFRNIYPNAHTLLIDMREMALCHFSILVCQVKTNMVESVYLHLMVDSSCHNITWGKRKSFIILLHELLTIW